MSNVEWQFGDTRERKVFVGGLAWETPMETLRDYFAQFGDIVEAVVISDKLSGRSKGYGFVTFKEVEAAKKACEEGTPMINGRQANCNLAAQGAQRHKTMSHTPAPPPITNVGPPAATHLQWYIPPTVSAFQPLPLYGYSHAYIPAPAHYNHKVAYNGAAYYPQQMYTGAVMPANSFIPMYTHHQQPPLFHHDRAQAMGLPTHMFHSSTTGPFTQLGPTTVLSKPILLPTPGTYLN